MADKKISQLTGATTPLAGTEVIPVVQSGVTKNVSIDNLTAGKDVDMLSANIGTGTAITNTRATVGNNTGAPVAWGMVTLENCGGIAPPSNAGLSFGWNYSNGSGENNVVYGVSVGGAPRLRLSSWDGATLVDTLELMANNDVKISSGNLVIGTSGKGIDFSATSGTGTSELFDDYEEGTWTPAFASASGTITSISVNGATYTKVGRLVTLGFDVTITDNGSGGVAINVTGLPFALATTYSSAGPLIEIAAVGFGGFVNPNATTSLSLTKYDWTYPGGTNYRLVGAISYNV